MTIKNEEKVRNRENIILRWKHVNDNVTTIGANAAMGENFISEKDDPDAYHTLERIFEQYGRGDPKLLAYLRAHPEKRKLVPLAARLHDIGNFGSMDQDSGDYNKTTRKLHNGTGAAMINGRLTRNIAGMSDKELDKWMRDNAPEAHAELHKDTETKDPGNVTPRDWDKFRKEQYDLTRRALMQAQDLVQSGAIRTDRLKNILNQLGTNENVNQDIEELASAVRTHRDSASEQYDKDLGKSDKQKFNRERRKAIEKHTLPQTPLGKVIAFADKFPESLNGQEPARALAFSVKDSYDKSIGTSGDLPSGIADVMQFLLKEGDPEKINNHHSYTGWGKNALNTVRGGLANVMKLIAGGKLKDGEESLDKKDRMQAANFLMDKILNLRKEDFSTDRASKHAWEQLQRVKADTSGKDRQSIINYLLKNYSLIPLPEGKETINQAKGYDPRTGAPISYTGKDDDPYHLDATVADRSMLSDWLQPLWIYSNSNNS